jgi:hypothetical protein
MILYLIKYSIDDQLMHDQQCSNNDVIRYIVLFQEVPLSANTSILPLTAQMLLIEFLQLLMDFTG